TYAQASERQLQNKRGWFAVAVRRGKDLQRVLGPHFTPDTELVVSASWSFNLQMLSWAGKALRQPDAASDGSSIHLGCITNRALAYLLTREFALSRTPNEPMGLPGVPVPRLRAYDHHTTHAANGCYSSPFPEAVCAVIDGWG